MPHIRELRSRLQRKTSNVYDTLFTRRVSIYFTVVLARLGVSANTVSALNILVGLAACALIGFAPGPWLLLGVALVHLYAVLDSVDGELARFRESFSLKGLFLEDLSAYAMINAFQLAMGFYLARTQAIRWPAAVAIAMAAFGRNAMPVARRAILKSILTSRPVSAAVVAKHARLSAEAPTTSRSSLARLRSIVQDHVLHYTYIWIVLSSLVVVEQTLDLSRSRLVLVGFVFFSAGLVAKELGAVARYLLTDALETETLRIYEQARQIPTGRADGMRMVGDHWVS
jgi:phosphatidylglycerophosphate synthase